MQPLGYRYIQSSLIVTHPRIVNSRLGSLWMAFCTLLLTHLLFRRLIKQIRNLDNIMQQQFLCRVHHLVCPWKTSCLYNRRWMSPDTGEHLWTKLCSVTIAAMSKQYLELLEGNDVVADSNFYLLCAQSKKSSLAGYDRIVVDLFSSGELCPQLLFVSKSVSYYINLEKLHIEYLASAIAVMDTMRTRGKRTRPAGLTNRCWPLTNI